MFYRKTVLDNGITVMSEPVDSVRSVALGIWFSVGSRDESPPEAGMSHFMEHMMFKGTPSRSAKDISEQFDRLGAELNAFTSKEYTCYYARFVDEHLDTAFELLSDMCVNANLDDESCTSEREVVIEEIARMEDTPDDRIHEIFSHALWPDHPIGLPILGSRQTVGGFDHNQSITFRGKHYLTGNCVVAAAGSVDHDALVALTERFLNGMPVGARTVRPVAEAAGRSQIAVLEKETEQAHICYGVEALNAHHPDRFTLSVLDGILGGGMSSRLFQEIRERRGLVYAVYSFSMLFQDTGQFAVYAGTRPDNAEEVIRLIRTEMEKVAENGVTPEELDRVRQAAKGHLVLGMESTRNRMTRLGKNEVTGGEILSADEIMERFDAVTMDDLRRVSADALTREKVLAVIGPFTREKLEPLLG
ncbi:MAG: peptidase M16 [Actinobacteria bacterium HGW-Actinobacteria-7]|nr:MAG: peptidase M16 [Actinobacteria bacterium HGW-Actinobacteria-7]